MGCGSMLHRSDMEHVTGYLKQACYDEPSLDLLVLTEGSSYSLKH
jgi:hypothetical protein